MRIEDLEQQQVGIEKAADGLVNRVIGAGLGRLAEVAICRAEA